MGQLFQLLQQEWNAMVRLVQAMSPRCLEWLAAKDPHVCVTDPTIIVLTCVWNVSSELLFRRVEQF